jgi:hypothetical protein
LATKGIHPNILIKESLHITQPIIEKDVNGGLEVEIFNKYQNLNKIKNPREQYFLLCLSGFR